jgi:hypothetical protein
MRRYGVAVDVDRTADLYTQGWTLRQIAAELGLTETTVSDQLRRAGVTMRRGAPPHPASTEQIVELRDRGLSWSEVAKQVDMTVSGAWSRYQRAQPPSPTHGPLAAGGRERCPSIPLLLGRRSLARLGLGLWHPRRCIGA